MASDVRLNLKNIGLRDVAVADTKLSLIDGQEGILIYRGFRIEDLAERSSFAETAYLLLNGSLPDRGQLEQFNGELAAARQVPKLIFDSFRAWPKDADPMDVLQASVPILAMADPELKVETRDANVRKAIRILARMASVTAGWHRIRRGLEPLDPLSFDEQASHAANFLWQFTGRKPDPEMARALDVSMILQAEHTFNASTFACREVVSTRAHIYAGVSAAVGALSGSLHGGANARVMDMLLELESQGRSEGRSEAEQEESVVDWVRQRLERGEKIMGMGHAVYKTFDPRAIILKGICERLAKRTGYESRYRLLAGIEEESVKEFERRGRKGLKANVDFYSGLLYSMMGIPMEFMTPLFAMSLACGWCAHAIEEKFAEAQGKPALYRPQADYIGFYCGDIGCIYRPLEER